MILVLAFYSTGEALAVVWENINVPGKTIQYDSLQISQDTVVPGIEGLIEEQRVENHDFAEQVTPHHIEVNRKSSFVVLVFILSMAALVFLILNYYILRHRTSQKISELNFQVNIMEAEIGQRNQLSEEQQNKLIELDMFKKNIQNYFTIIENQLEFLRSQIIEVQKQNPLGLSTIRMLQLYNQLSNQIDIIKLENGEVKIRKKEFRLSEIFNALKELFSHQIQTKNIKIEKKGINTVAIVSDPILIEKVLRNLFDNAVRFAPNHGLIRITQTLKEGEFMEVRIWNEGDSIPKKHVFTIFKKYIKLPIKKQANTGNAGLGLAVSKYIIEMLNGEIGVVPASGNGMEFWFSIPVQQVTSVTLR